MKKSESEILILYINIYLYIILNYINNKLLLYNTSSSFYKHTLFFAEIIHFSDLVT